MQKAEGRTRKWEMVELRRLLQRLISTTHVVDMADGGSSMTCVVKATDGGSIQPRLVTLPGPCGNEKRFYGDDEEGRQPLRTMNCTPTGSKSQEITEFKLPRMPSCRSMNKHLSLAILFALFTRCLPSQMKP